MRGREMFSRIKNKWAGFKQALSPEKIQETCIFQIINRVRKNKG